MIIVSSRHRLKQKYDKYPELEKGWHLSFQEGYNCTPPGRRTYLFLDVPDACPLINPHRGLMTGEQMLEMIEFIEAWTKSNELESKPSSMLVSCGRGRSRSTAGAIVAHYLASWEPSEHAHGQAVDWLFANYPKSTPNGWMLKLADNILDTTLFDYCSERFVKWTEKRPA